MDRSFRFLLLALSLAPSAALAAGQLQIHFMDVGQGDGAILISPGGETVMFDNGVVGQCDQPLAYLATLGIKKIDYHVASHYHADHIGCTAQVLGKYPLVKDAFDRGGSYPSVSFTAYANAVGKHRRRPDPGSRIVLDEGTAHPVEIEFVALNGDGVPTTNENDMSLVAVIHYGSFDAEIGGDLSGYDTDKYNDIETPVAHKVGRMELYKVHHHGSRYSSNPYWMSAIQPKVAIVSASRTNTYGHPTPECMDRIHKTPAHSYWTEQGAGATPIQGRDTVSNGAVVVKVEPAGKNFSVTYGAGRTDRYTSW